MSQQLFSFEGRFITLAQINRIKAERETVANATGEVKTEKTVGTTTPAKPVAKAKAQKKATAKAKKVEKIVETKVEESPATPAVEEAK